MNKFLKVFITDHKHKDATIKKIFNITIVLSIIISFIGITKTLVRINN